MKKNAMTRFAAVALALTGLLLLGLLVAQRPGARPGPAKAKKGPAPGHETEFTRLNEEGFPLNVDPKIVPAAEAALDDGDMVMGAVINGEARAYPVNYMIGPTNEVVNDVLGGQAIAPSW